MDEKTHKPDGWAQIIALIICLVICFGAAAIGGAVTTPSLPGWYSSLAKPSWNPPNWIFAPVWSTLYFLMAISAWLVWRKSGLKPGLAALTCFVVQLVLNVIWSWLFFGLQQPFFAAIEILILWGAILVTMILFARHSNWASLLLLPYLLWVSFAAVLNWTIWSLN